MCNFAGILMPTPEKPKRDKYRMLHKMTTHELSELDEDFNLSVLSDKDAVAIVVLNAQELKLLKQGV